MQTYAILQLPRVLSMLARRNLSLRLVLRRGMYEKRNYLDFWNTALFQELQKNAQNAHFMHSEQQKSCSKCIFSQRICSISM